MASARRGVLVTAGEISEIVMNYESEDNESNNSDFNFSGDFPNSSDNSDSEQCEVLRDARCNQAASARSRVVKPAKVKPSAAVREVSVSDNSSDNRPSENSNYSANNFRDVDASNVAGPSNVNKNLDHRRPRFISESDGDSNASVDANSEASDNESDNSVTTEPPQAKRRRRQPAQPPMFDWKSDNNFEPVLFDFDSSMSGVNDAFNLPDNPSELDIFRAIFDIDLVHNIVTETNRYYSQVVISTDVSAKSKLNKWVDTTTSEMYTFLATVMLMGHTKKNSLKQYWSTDPLLSTPFFGQVFSQDRFLLLLRMLHFCNNDDQPEGDKLFKINSVLTPLKTKFKTILFPFQNLCIDETLMAWKGRLGFRQYIPSKRNRFGIKMFVLCDCETGFVLDLIVYTGAGTAIDNYEDVGMSGSVVMTLLQEYTNKGHNLFIDNWYTSPILVKKLHDNMIGCCGTVRCNRRGMPDLSQKLKKGDVISRHTDVMVAVKWHDKRDVTMLSSLHSNEMQETGKIDRATGVNRLKPASVLEYNMNMGLVDKADMQLSFVESARKSIKWYKKFFFHLLDVSVLNSYLIYQVKTGKKPQLSEFRINLIRQIIEEFKITRSSPKGGRPSTSETPLRLSERHFPVPVPTTPGGKKNRQKQCRVCSQTKRRPQKRTDSRYMCEQCDVGLCLNPCFADYHTLKHF